MTNIDELIRKAIEEGKFSNLQGEGKPLRLEENPWEDPDWRMAYHVLQSNGFTLPWIEQRQAIERDLEAARRLLAQAWREHQNDKAISGERAWQRALQTFELQIGAINQQITDYNLSVPLDRFQKRLVRVEQEVDRLTTPPLSDRL
jgi:Domain of unknown function (DUF1992)